MIKFFDIFLFGQEISKGAKKVFQIKKHKNSSEQGY